MKNTHKLVGRGLIVSEGKVLLVKHSHPNTNAFWCFPGGRVEEGETVRGAVERELMEETHLKVNVGLPVAVQEFVEDGIVEIIFSCEIISGEALLGIDPDNSGIPILEELKWFAPDELNYINVYPKEFISKLFKTPDGIATVPFMEVVKKRN